VVNYLLNLHKFDKKSAIGEEYMYRFDLETPLLFPSALGNKKTQIKHLEIKTKKSEAELFSQYH
jgi:hypothetical protein